MPPSSPSQTALLLLAADELLGTPYLWWAKGPEFGELERPKDPTSFRKLPTPADPLRGGVSFALDCSGFVTTVVFRAGGPDFRWSHNTDKLWNELRPTKVPTPGDLAFYGGRGEKDVDHVMLVSRVLHTGEVMVIGASGGDSSTTSLARARDQNAKVKVKSSHLYRADFRGFRSGPLHT